MPGQKNTAAYYCFMDHLTFGDSTAENAIKPPYLLLFNCIETYALPCDDPLDYSALSHSLLAYFMILFDCMCYAALNVGMSVMNRKD
jgi:hypothetical protein